MREERSERMAIGIDIPVSTTTLPCKCVPISGTSNRDMVVEASIAHRKHKSRSLNEDFDKKNS